MIANVGESIHITDSAICRIVGKDITTVVEVDVDTLSEFPVAVEMHEGGRIWLRKDEYEWVDDGRPLLRDVPTSGEG